MQKLKKQKLYVLALKNRSENYISKIGETKDQLEKRILGFGFGGKWKGREKDVEIILELDTLLGKALEDIVKGLDTLLSSSGFIAIGTTRETIYGYTDIFIAKTYDGEWDSIYSNNLLLNNLNQRKKTINIYPNPTKRFLHLENISLESNIFIYNSFGKIVQAYKSKNLIDLENLKNGIYWIEIKNESNNFLTKFIKL